jgi:hypothetical protein
LSERMQQPLEPVQWREVMRRNAHNFCLDGGLLMQNLSKKL